MKRFTVVISVVCALVFAGLLGYSYWKSYGLWALAIYAAMALALPFSSLTHELGHMLFGAICKIKAVPRLKIFGSSSCKLIPKTDKSLRARVFITALGGILINLLFIMLGVLAMWLNAVPDWLALFLPASVYLFLMNLMPVQFANGKTDGLICNNLLNKTDDSKVMLAVLTVQAQVLNGKPIEEVDENLLFNVPQIREDDAGFIALTELRYEYFAAKGEAEQAEKYKSRFEQLKKEYM